MSGSRALYEIAERVEKKGAGEPVTWGELAEVFRDAADWLNGLEHEEYMGEDL